MQRHPNEVDMATMHRIGKAIQSKDPERARNEIHQFLKREPSYSSSLMYMSLFLEILGDTEEALKTILLAIVMEPNDDLTGHHYKLVARLLDRQGRKADVEQVLKNGWEKIKNQYPGKIREKERRRFYDLYNRLPIEGE